MGSDLQILVTENTEYFVSGTTCVGVRDVHSGAWNAGHRAVGAELLGSFQWRPNEDLTFIDEADLGGRLYFDADILTSPLTRVVAPAVMAGECARGIEAA
jgi:hypothetical protein